MATPLTAPLPAPFRKLRSKYLPAWARIVCEPSEVPINRERMRGAPDAARLLTRMLAAEEVENFCVICLDGAACVLAVSIVTRGILNSSLVHPREVFRLAIAVGAAGIIVGHNHPSGDPTPSADDRDITRQLVEAGRLLDLPVYDHVVVGRSPATPQYISFAEAGLL